MDTYVLDGHETVREPDINKWGKQLEDSEGRQIGSTEIGEARVSTVFLVFDHRFGDGPPMLFETMVFDGELDGEMERYSTWDEAVTGHEHMVERVRVGTKQGTKAPGSAQEKS